jgi:gamma-glutamylputrescine oxidase
LNRRQFLKRCAWATAGTAAAATALNEISPLVFPEHPVFDINQSLWMDAQPPHNPPLSRDLDADVAVIGGGFTGLSSAYHIAQLAPGWKVVLLEAHGVGNGASGRNGGMLLPNTANEYMKMSSPPDLHRKIYQATVDSMRELLVLSEQSNIPGVVQPLGALETFPTEAAAAEGRAYASQAQKLGMPVEFWDVETTAQAIGTRAYHGALFDPNGGHVHPMKLVQAEKQAAESQGVQIFEDSPVASVEEGSLIRIHLAGGQTVTARILVLAANAYSSKLGFFRNAIAPIYEYVAATPPLAAQQLAATNWNTPMPFADSNDVVFYLGRTDDNRIHIGGGSPAYEFNNGVAERPNRRAWNRLSAQLGKLFPNLAGVAFDRKWDGLVDMTLDWEPSVGVMGKHANIFYGIGYCGHGVNLTFMFGKVIADLVTGQSAKWKEFPFLNRKPPYLPNEPFRWLGVEAELEYYRLTQA